MSEWKMKVLAISASHRGENGYTHFMLNKFLSGLRDGGSEVETIVLSKIKMNRCTGCESCQTKTPGRCVFDEKDDVRNVFNKIEESDLLVFASPVYVYNISGLLKIFFERYMGAADMSKLFVNKNGVFTHGMRQELYKPFVAIAVCDNIDDV
ncbi:MAG TPA: flavodoxin family protein, partial [Actinobacteria bacterium]|nr:flavodoxin family protein [Actinomycetota bacterium]